MAVFTSVDEASAADWLAGLGAGRLLSMQGIAAGIENTNYFVQTDQGPWVLTLFERLTDEQLPFYLGLMKHLARVGLPVPDPRADSQGRLVHALAGKPAALVNRLPGHHVTAPDLHHAQQVGAVLARMHAAAADFELTQPNLRGLAWCEATAPRVRPHLSAAQRQLLDAELVFQRQLAVSPAYAQLPRAAVHADLFRDNVLFDGPAGHASLTACLDFYFAGVDTLGYDLAVALNDWCIDDDSAALDEPRAASLVAAYQTQRHLTPGEARLLPALLRAAALRFWLSRLADLVLPRDAALLAPKDPSHFERALRRCVDQPWHPER